MRSDLTLEEWKRLERDWSGGLSRGSEEWEAAWKALVKQTGDRDRAAECPVSGECWEYVSSFRDRGRWTHEFRHRRHPLKKRRWYVRVDASPDWNPEDDRPKPTVH
jgi:hypothetical protein